MDCRVFVQEFVKNCGPNDILPLKVPSYYVRANELKGQITDWVFQYLQLQNPPCPSKLIVSIANKVLENVLPMIPGLEYSEGKGIEPVQLMKQVISSLYFVCQNLASDDNLDAVVGTNGPRFHEYAVHAIRNTRRKMEDRHVVIQDMNSLFGLKTSVPVSYYGVFDGHAGTDAAFYAAAHLHYHLVQSEYFPSDIPLAFKEAFSETDEQFAEVGKFDSLKSGTTAVCSLLYGNDVYVAWLGDSQAIISRNGQVEALVNPHRPSREDEIQRIEALGGSVFNWDGVHRVQGCIAVSRAIGDTQLKPYVSSEADVTATKLDSTADFLILGCDGIWDCVSYEEAIGAVIRSCRESETMKDAAVALVSLAKKNSSDNITVLVVFFKDLLEIQSLDPPPLPFRTSTSEDSFVTRVAANHLDFSTGSDPMEAEKQMFNDFLKTQESSISEGRPSSEMVASVLAPNDSAFADEDETVYVGAQTQLAELMRNKSDSELAILLAASAAEDEDTMGDQVEGPVLHGDSSKYFHEESHEHTGEEEDSEDEWSFHKPALKTEPTKGAMSEERLPNLDQPIADFVDKQNFIYSSEEPESSLVQLDPKVVGGVVNGHDPVNGHEPDPGIVRSCTLFDSGSVPVDVSASTNPFAEHSSNPFSSNFEIPARDNACDNSDNVEKHEIGDFSVSSSSDMDRNAFNMDSESNYYDNSDNLNGNGIDVVQEFVLPKPNPNVLSFSDLQKRHEERHEGSFEPSDDSAFETKFEAMNQSYERHVEVVAHAAIDEPLLPEETIPRDLGLAEEAFQLSALNDVAFETAAEFPDDLNPLAKVQEPLASAPKSNEEDRLVLVQRPADGDENSEDGISRPESANQQEGEFAKLTELDQEISKIADSDCKGQRQDLMNGSHLMSNEIKMPEEIDEYKQFADLHENEKTFEPENPVKSDECFETVMPTKEEEVVLDSYSYEKEVELEKSFGSDVVGFVDSIEKDSSLNVKSSKLEETENDIPTHFEIETDASQSIFEAGHEKEATTTNVVAEVHEEDHASDEARSVPELDQTSVDIDNTVNNLHGLINNTDSLTTDLNEKSTSPESVLNEVCASATERVDVNEELDISMTSASIALEKGDICADLRSEVSTEIKSDIDSVTIPTKKIIDEEIATEIKSDIDSAIALNEETIGYVKDEEIATEINHDIDSVVATEDNIGNITDEKIATEIRSDIDSVIVSAEEAIDYVKDEIQSVGNVVQEVLAVDVDNTTIDDDNVSYVDEITYNSVEGVKQPCYVSGETEHNDEIKELVSAIDNVVEDVRETTNNVTELLSATDNVVDDVMEHISDSKVKDIGSDIPTDIDKSSEVVNLDLVKVDDELNRATVDADTAVTEIINKVDNEVKFVDGALREPVDSVHEDVKVIDSELAKDQDTFGCGAEQRVDELLAQTLDSFNEVERTVEKTSVCDVGKEYVEDVVERRQESPVEFDEKQVESIKADSLFGARVSGEFDLRTSHVDVAADPQAEGIPQFSQESFEELASTLKQSDSQTMPDVVENIQWREPLLNESAMLPVDESYIDESTLLAEQSVVELNEPLGDLVAELNKLNLEGDNLEQKMIQDLEKLGITSQDTFQLENQDSEVTSTKDTPASNENQQTFSTAPVEDSVVQPPPPDVSLSSQLTEIGDVPEASKPELVPETSVNQTEHASTVENVSAETVREQVAEPIKVETASEPIKEHVSEPITEHAFAEQISEQVSEPITEQAVAEPIKEQVSDVVTEKAAAEPILEQAEEKSSAQPVETRPVEQVSESIPEQKLIVELGPEVIFEQSHAQPVVDQVAVEPINQQDSVVEQATGATSPGEVVIPSVIQELEAAAPLISQEPETEHSEVPIVMEASSTVDTPAETETKQEKPSVSSPVSESGATIGSEIAERVQPVAKVAPTQKGKPAVTVKGKPQTTKEASKKEAAKPNRPTNLAIKETKKPAPKPAQTKPIEKKPAATSKPVSTASPTTKPVPKPAVIKKTSATMKPSENEVKTNASKPVSDKPRTASTTKTPASTAAKASPRAVPAVSPVKKTVATATAKVDTGAPAAKAAPGTARPLPRVALMSKPKPVENGAVNGPAVQKKPVASRPASVKSATKAAPKPATKSPPKPKQPTTPPGSPPKPAAEATPATE